MTNQANMGSTLAAGKAPKKRKIASLDRRKARAGWIFVLPFIIGFLIIYLPMIYESLMLSFHSMSNNTTSAGGYTLEFIGFDNYVTALTKDPQFTKVLVTGLTTLAFDIPAILIFSLFMAVMLNQKAAGRGAFRAIFFIPVILSTGIMETFDPPKDPGEVDYGTEESLSDSLVSSMDMERLFANMQVGTGIVKYVTEAINNIFNIVNRSGVQMLIFLAALQSISPAIYESCKIDGATSWETFWKITFPMLSPMILVNGVYTIIDSFTTDSNPVMQFIGEMYNGDSKVLSSAMAWIYFLIVILIVAVIASILSAFVFYQRKND